MVYVYSQTKYFIYIRIYNGIKVKVSFWKERNKNEATDCQSWHFHVFATQMLYFRKFLLDFFFQENIFRAICIWLKNSLPIYFLVPHLDSQSTEGKVIFASCLINQVKTSYINYE